jgi:regulatory factor X 1/2/3
MDTFCIIYGEHCEALLDESVNKELHRVESLWTEFWQSQDNNNGDESQEKYLPRMKLYIL